MEGSKPSASRASPAYTATCEHCDGLALQPSQTLRFKAAHKRRQRNRPYLQMVVLKCCGNELTKRVLSTLSPVLAQCGLNLPKVSKSKIKAKQLVLSNATERSDLSITTAQRTPVRSTPLFHLSAKHRSNESMTTLLFNIRVRANHQVVRSRNHAEITQQIFCSSNGISGTDTQQHIK